MRRFLYEACTCLGGALAISCLASLFFVAISADRRTAERQRGVPAHIRASGDYVRAGAIYRVGGERPASVDDDGSS